MSEPQPNPPKRTYSNRKTSNTYSASESKRSLHQRSITTLSSPAATAHSIHHRRTRSFPTLLRRTYIDTLPPELPSSVFDNVLSSDVKLLKHKTTETPNTLSANETSSDRSHPAVMAKTQEEAVTKYNEKLFFSSNVCRADCEAWRQHRYMISQEIITAEPAVNFFIGIAQYRNRIGTKGGTCIFAIVEEQAEKDAIHQAIVRMTMGSNLSHARIIIDYGCLMFGYDDRRLEPKNAPFTEDATPGISIGTGSTGHSGSLGMWIPQTNLFITNSHDLLPVALSQSPYPHRNTVCNIRAPSKQDSDLRRASLVQARAEAQRRFHNTHYRMSEKPAMAKYVVQTVLRTQNELRTHDEGEQGNIWHLGACIAGWKGVAKDPDNPSKTFWVDVAVASGDPSRRSNLVAGSDLDTIPWKAPRHGMAVMKVGRTTGKTTGHLCPEEGILHIANQGNGPTGHIVTNEWFILPGEIDKPGTQETNFSQSGDSGSVILAGDSTSVVGMMFASSKSTERVMADLTFFMPAERVARAVNLLMAEEVVEMSTNTCQFELEHRPMIEEQLATPKSIKRWAVNVLVEDVSKETTSEKEISSEEQQIEEEPKEEVFTEDADIDWDLYPEFNHLV